MPTWLRWVLIVVVVYVLWTKFGSRLAAKA